MDFSFYAVGKSRNLVGIEDLIGFGIGTFGKILLAIQYPGFTHGAIEKTGVALFRTEVGKGMGMCNEFAAGADLLDQVNSDVGIGNFDTFDNFADHGIDFVVDDKLSVVKSDAEV